MNNFQESAMAADQGIESIALKSALIDTLVFNGQQFHVRASDRYWDATRMCQAYGKRINNFLRIESTQRYLNALSRKTGIAIEVDTKSAMAADQGTESIALKSALIYKSKGGDVEESGTWVHQQIALKLAAWLNEDFEVWVWEVVEKLLTQGQVHLKDEIEALGKALHLKDEEIGQIAIEYAMLEHQFDQLKYENDELAELAQWRKTNSWTGRDS